MKHLSYYCSNYVMPAQLESMKSKEALEHKIVAGKRTVKDLMEVRFEWKDIVRINKTLEAIGRWEEEIRQMEGKDDES